ncbi:MAG: hypothetical protein EOP83_09985 [Verrucomicrobiaceae bacterium]|nr:MAG: hypothetical protein EOP83_09985 [Verrucomicrobiaceae bacterium]
MATLAQTSARTRSFGSEIARRVATPHTVTIAKGHEMSDVVRWVKSSEAKGRYRMHYHGGGIGLVMSFSLPETAFMCKLKFG